MREKWNLYIAGCNKDGRGRDHREREVKLQRLRIVAEGDGQLSKSKPVSPLNRLSLIHI